jgi:hypothetical protein
MGGTGGQRREVKQSPDIFSKPKNVAQEVLGNGTTKMNGSISKMDQRIEKEENIFLFIPNVIG